VHPIPSYPSLRSRPSCFRSFTFSRLSIFGIINPRTTKLYRLLKLLSTVGRETRCLSLSLFFNFHTCRQKKARSRHKTELNFVEGSGKQTQPHRPRSIRCSPRTQDFLLFFVLLRFSFLLCLEELETRSRRQSRGLAPGPKFAPVKNPARACRYSAYASSNDCFT
jgi:hypothetical protein